MRICFVLLAYLLTETFAIPTPLPSPPKDVIVNVITRKWTHLLNEKFLSFTLQPHIALEFQDYSPATLNMFKGLSPGMLRLGGPETNALTFLTPGKNSEYTIVEEQWKRINRFCQKTKLDLIVCVNPMERLHDVWQSRGVLEFIDASDKLGYNLEWQLGYELQRLTNNSEALSGSELGRDVVRMRKILDSFPRYSKSSIIGPDVIASSTPQEIQFIKEYLNESGDALTALTWHPSFSAEERESEDVSRTLSQIQQQLENLIWARDLTKPPNVKQIPKKEVWLSESNPEEYTGKFEDALTWTKRLGTAAMLGFPVIMKQIPTNTISQPTPDFWVSILYKSLVGRAVLETKLATGDKNTSQVFAHCTEMSPNNIIDGDFEYERGAVTLFGLNLADEEIKLNVKASIKDEPVHMYFLTAENKNNPEETNLNGQRLSLSPTGELPIISPKVKNATRNVVVDVPSRSVYFIVFPDIKVRPCTLYPSSQSNGVKTNSVQQTATSTNSKFTDSSSKNSDGGKEVYVRFGPKKKRKNLSPDDSNRNEFFSEKLLKLNPLASEFESDEERELERSPKSVKDIVMESSGKNKLLKTPSKENPMRLAERRKILKSEGWKTNKGYETDESEISDKELSQAMLNTKFIMFSDDDWMSDFSHAKKAVEAAKKIIEAFDEAEIVKNKDSSQRRQSVLQVDNDKYHVQYGKEALRKKKFAVLTAAVLEKQNSSVNENITNKEFNNNAKPIPSDQQTLQANSAEPTNSNDLKNDTDRHRRHVAKTKALPWNEMDSDLLLSDILSHALIKRKQDYEDPYSEQQSRKKVKSHSADYDNQNIESKAKKEHTHRDLSPDQKFRDSGFKFGSQRSNADSLQRSDIYLSRVEDSPKLNGKNKFDERKINDRELFKEENESDDSKDERDEVYSSDKYYPGEFYEHRKLKKNDRKTTAVSGYDDLSEADLVGKGESEEMKPDIKAPTLTVVKEGCKDETQDKIMKEKAEKQLNKYYENTGHNDSLYEELGDYSEENWHEKEDDGNKSEKNKTVQNDRKPSTKLLRQNEDRVKRSVSEIKSKTKPNKKLEHEKTQHNLRKSRLTSEKENSEHDVDVKKNTHKNNTPSKEEKLIKKSGPLTNKHISKRETVSNATAENSLRSQPLENNLSTMKHNVSEIAKESDNENNEKMLSKRGDEIKLLSTEPTVNKVSGEKGLQNVIDNLMKSSEEVVADVKIVPRSEVDLKNGSVTNETNAFLSELPDNITKINENDNKYLFGENTTDMTDKGRLIRGSENSEFKLEESSVKNEFKLHEDDTKSKISNGGLLETKVNNTINSIPNNSSLEISAPNLLKNKQENKEAKLPSSPSFTVSILDGDQFSSSLNTNISLENSEMISDDNFDENIKHDIDIVCGRTKNFGTFCVGSERAMNSTDVSSQNNDLLTLETSGGQNKLNDSENEDSRAGLSKKSSLHIELKENSPDLKSTFIQRREISENGESPISISNLEKEVSQQNLDAGSPSNKASRSAPYIEDFEELLSQIQSLETNSDNVRPRRLIRFTVPAFSSKSINVDDSNVPSLEETEKQNSENGLKNKEALTSESSDQKLGNHSDKQENQPIYPLLSSNEGSEEDHDKNSVKINYTTNLLNEDVKYGRQIKRTVVPARKESGPDVHYKVQDGGMGYLEEEDEVEEEMIPPEKMFMVPIRNFRNKGNLMFRNYYDEDEFIPNKQQKSRDESDYDGEPEGIKQIIQNKKSQQTKAGLHQVPNSGSNKNSYLKNEEGSHRIHKYDQEHGSLTGDLIGQMLAQDNKRDFKSGPIQMMPVMLMPSDIFKSKHSSRSSNYQRVRRSLVPYFHNFKNDIANLKNDVIHFQILPQNNDRIHPRSPNIKRQYPLNLKVNNLVSHVNPSTAHTNSILKEIHYRKRSARDVSNSLIEKKKSITDFNDDKNTVVNKIFKDVSKEMYELKDGDAYDISLIKDKNKLISSLTNKLENLTKVYIKESAAKNKETHSPVNDLKNSAEEEENKASELTEKNKTKTAINSSGIPRIQKNLHDTSDTLQESQNTFNFVVTQMKGLINFIVHNLAQLG